MFMTNHSDIPETIIPYDELAKIAFNMATVLRMLELVLNDPEGFPGVDPKRFTEGLTSDTLHYIDNDEAVQWGVDEMLAYNAQRFGEGGGDEVVDFITALLGDPEAFDGLGVFVVDERGITQVSNLDNMFDLGFNEARPEFDANDPVASLEAALRGFVQ